MGDNKNRETIKTVETINRDNKNRENCKGWRILSFFQKTLHNFKV